MEKLHRSGRRRFLLGSGAIALLGTAAFPRGVRAQGWPARPVRIIVSFPPGGLTDLYARAYGEYLSSKLGQPVLIENRAGAGGVIGCDAVAKSPADGYTLLFTISTPIVQAQALYKKLPYDPDRDFTFISAFDSGHLPLAVHRDVPAVSFREFVDFAKKTAVNFGSYGPGSVPHMVAAQINKLFGTRIEVVHYKGEAAMWVEVAAGRIHAAIGSISALSPHLQSAAVRPIAVNTAKRSPKLPQVATYLEQGFPEKVFMLKGWLGLLGPAGLPAEVVSRVSKLILEGAETPRLKQIYETFGLAEKPTTPEGFVSLYREEGPVMIAIARELGVSLD
jgi:tripartite-type tricarboxylate transporter receptor subunit TctC